jgi:hypothetical protein
MLKVLSKSLTIIPIGPTIYHKSTKTKQQTRNKKKIKKKFPPPLKIVRYTHMFQYTYVVGKTYLYQLYKQVLNPVDIDIFCPV